MQAAVTEIRERFIAAPVKVRIYVLLGFVAQIVWILLVLISDVNSKTMSIGLVNFFGGMFWLYLLLRRVRIVWVISYLAILAMLPQAAIRFAAARQSPVTMAWFVINLLLALVSTYCLLSRETRNFAFGRSQP